jgi:hypothetical protein
MTQAEQQRLREEALRRICAMRRPLPKNWRFNRDEANERD